MRLNPVARRVAASLALTMGLSSAADAQDEASLRIAPDSKIRLELWNGQRHEGTVVSIGPDTLRARVEGGATPAFRVADIARIEVLSGQRRHMQRGATIGGLIGGSLGALLGAITYDGKPDIIVGSRGEAALLSGVLVGLPGLVIGTMVGAVPRDEWRPAHIERRTARFEFRPLPTGRGVALALSF